MTYKEFYIWLDGFMTNRDWVIIKQVDIEIIQNKMKEVKDDNPVFDIEKFKHLGKGNQLITPEYKPMMGDEDDLGYPPKIVM